MRTLFYHTSQHWTGAARAFGAAARGLASFNEPVTVACRTGTLAEQVFTREGLDVVALPAGDSIAREAWRLR